MRLLVTRPEPDAERTATALRARGHMVVVIPLLRIEAVESAELGPGTFAAILVTSANAAPAVVRHRQFAQFRALPVFAVGERSAQAMRAAGFADVSFADGDAGDLARLVTERLKPGMVLLHLAGADRSGNLGGTLSARGFVVHTTVIYRAVAAGAFPPVAAEVVAGGIDGVLHFSRRSAEAYVSAVRDDERALKKPAHFCLSAHVSVPLAQAGAPDVRVAPQPTEAALIALIPAP